MSDLISRQDAINAIENTDCELTNKDWNELTGALKSLPSAESTGAMDEAIQKYIKDGYMQPIGEDIISRKALMKRISEEYHEYGDDYDALQILGDIEDFPSAPDSRQHGEWVWDSDDGEYFCSECRTAQGNSTTEIISGEWKFCPNCGADMRGGEDE